MLVTMMFAIVHGGSDARAADTAQIIATFVLATATRTPTPINVGNFVWNDLDADGRQDAGEPGLSGVTVQLWNSTKTTLIASTVTNANGNYTLVAPSPGNYRVRVVLQSINDTFTVKDGAADDLLDSDVNPGGVNAGFTDVYAFASNLISITSIDAGIVRYATPTPTRTPTPINIGNFIWADDGDGIQEAGEAGVPNVTVQLWNGSASQLIASTVTNANGNYTLVAPTPGDYRIRVLSGIGAGFAPKDNAIDDIDDSDCNSIGVSIGFSDVFSLASNVISISSKDCGLIGPYSTATPTPPGTPTPTATGTPTLTPTATGTPTLTPTFEPDLTETVIVVGQDSHQYLPIALR
jgi:hypothetical protein